MICNINNIKYTDTNNFFLIAGPCIIENDRMPLEIAEKINHICNIHKVPFIFKASYRKANRSKLDSFTGIGDQKGLKVLRDVGESLNIPVLTDIHSPEEANLAAKYVDVLQIPAFLCRQTDLLIAAAKAGKPVNIKKGQFLSAEAMKFAVEKVRQAGNQNIMLTERGSMFGYQDLIIDFRGIPVMQQNEVPVILDITHSLQQPNQAEGITGGKPEMIECMAKAGIATGVDGLFIETHPNPAVAKSDGANMLKLDKLENLIVKLLKIRRAII